MRENLGKDIPVDITPGIYLILGPSDYNNVYIYKSFDKYSSK